MATIKPFRALRPKEELADKIAALPYDVMNREEAKAMAKDNPYSFLHIDRAEIDLPDEIDIYDEKVYEKSRENLVDFYKKSYLVREDEKSFYIYREIMDGREQTGILACVSVDESMDGTIKKHEYTKPDKEEDRTKNIRYCKANTGTILLTFRNTDRIRDNLKRQKEKKPLFDFTSDDGVRHTVWKIDAKDDIDEFVEAFGELRHLYVADGHHRSAAAENYAKERREENPNFDGTEEFNFYTAMIAPDEELYVMDYNRVVKDLNGLDEDEFLEAVRKNFDVELLEPGIEKIRNKNIPEASIKKNNDENLLESKEDENLLESKIEKDRRNDDLNRLDEDYSDIEKIVKPNRKREYAMYVGEKWYRLREKQGEDAQNTNTLKKEEIECKKVNPVEDLDVSVLNEKLIEPILGITNPKADPRIDFVGGIRGMKGLEDRVKDDMKVAFALYPTPIEYLMRVADENMIMPAKSTWFEPKVRCGIVVHEIEEIE